MNQNTYNEEPLPVEGNQQRLDWLKKTRLQSKISCTGKQSIIPQK